MEAPLKCNVQIVVYPKAPTPPFFLYITTFLIIFNHLFLYLLTKQLYIFHPVPKPLTPSFIRRSLNLRKVV